MFYGIELRRRNLAQSCEPRIQRRAVRRDCRDQAAKVIHIHPVRLRVGGRPELPVLPRAGVHLYLIECLQRQAPGKAAGSVAGRTTHARGTFARVGSLAGHPQVSRRRKRLAISIATSAASAPLFPALPPARSMACSTVSVVNTPKATGTPVSSAMRAMPAAHSPPT